MTRRGLASALLPATVAALLAAVVLSSAGGSATAAGSPRNAVAPLRATSLNLVAARPPLLGGAPVSKAASATAACDAASGVTCSEVVVPLDLTHSSYADHVVMSTADIAFIAAGAFSGFQQIAHRRAMRDSIGFGREQAANGGDPDAIAVDFTADQVENVANFQAYGFLPELVARFTRVVPFKALDADTLKDLSLIHI